MKFSKRISDKEIVLLILNIPFCLLLSFIFLVLFSVLNKGKVLLDHQFSGLIIACAFFVALTTLLTFRLLKLLTPITAFISLLEITIIYLAGWQYFSLTAV
jgi:hypothetical protein